MRSKIAPDIQPPIAMPNSANISATPVRTPASFDGKYSRTITAYIGMMPPWNRPNNADTM